MKYLQISLLLCLSIFIGLSGCFKLNPVIPGAGSPATNSAAAANGLVLWNKLGSASEVTGGAHGSGMTIVGTPTYETGVFGNGVRITINNHLEVSTANILSNQGAVEMWTIPDVGFVAAQRFFFEIVDNVGASIGVYLNYNSGFPAGQRFTFINSPNSAYGPEGGVTNPGVAVHVAAVWDYNGIGGGANTIRLYTNGSLCMASNSGLPMVFKPNGTFRLGLSWDNTRPYAGVIDNLKVWNYAKTNFSDRFSE